MKTVTLFDRITGEFGAVLTVPDSAVDRYRRNGTSFKDGRYDKHSQRVDIATGEVVAHQKRPEVAIAERQQAARKAIASAERRQARAVREALLALLPEGPERDRMERIDDEIASQRDDLSADGAGG